MKLVRYGPAGGELPAVIAGGLAYDLRPVTPDIDTAFFDADGISQVRRAVGHHELDPVDLSGLRLGSPVRNPRALICVGMNYAAHAAESGAPPPDTPVIFLKHPGCLSGPFDDVIIPRESVKTDWEVELAVIIGRTARYLESDEDALRHIAGYAVSNDVSERHFQLEISGGQWSKGKSCETFNPLGPYLVTPDEVDPGDLRLTSSVDGEPRQDSSTADMIFPATYLVRHLSHFMTLMPGDVINTGTPQGVALSGRFPYLRPGNVMTLEIAGLGRQEQRLVAAP